MTVRAGSKCHVDGCSFKYEKMRVLLVSGRMHAVTGCPLHGAPPEEGKPGAGADSAAPPKSPKTPAKAK